VCAVCRVCGEEEWPVVPCSARADTVCKPIGVNPEFNGHHMKAPDGKLYLIDRGYRREVPDAKTFSLLFTTWEDVEVPTVDVLTFRLGVPFAKNTVLFRLDTSADEDPNFPGPKHPIFLIDEHKKRAIRSKSTAAKYGFNLGAVRQLPLELVNLIPDGDEFGSDVEEK